MSKEETMRRLAEILAELYDARYEGGNAQRLYRAQGLADGYMRALTDFNLVTQAELLSFVAEQQRRGMSRADARPTPVMSRVAPNFA